MSWNLARLSRLSIVDLGPLDWVLLALLAVPPIFVFYRANVERRLKPEGVDPITYRLAVRYLLLIVVIVGALIYSGEAAQLTGLIALGIALFWLALLGISDVRNGYRPVQLEAEIAGVRIEQVWKTLFRTAAHLGAEPAPAGRWAADYAFFTRAPPGTTTDEAQRWLYRFRAEERGPEKIFLRGRIDIFDYVLRDTGESQRGQGLGTLLARGLFETFGDALRSAEMTLLDRDGQPDPGTRIALSSAAPPSGKDRTS